MSDDTRTKNAKQLLAMMKATMNLNLDELINAGVIEDRSGQECSQWTEWNKDAPTFIAKLREYIGKVDKWVDACTALEAERDTLKEALAADINFLSQLASALVNKNSGAFKCAWTDYGEKLMQIVARRALESKP